MNHRNAIILGPRRAVQFIRQILVVFSTKVGLDGVGGQEGKDYLSPMSTFWWAFSTYWSAG